MSALPARNSVPTSLGLLLVVLGLLGAGREGPAMPLFAAGVGAIALASLVAERKPDRAPGPAWPSALPAMAFLALGAASFAWSWDRSATVTGLLAWGAAVLAADLSFRTARRPGLRDALVQAVAMAAVGVGLAAVLRPEWVGGGAGPMALSGTFGRTNDLAGWSLVGLGAVLAQLVRSRGAVAVAWGAGAALLLAELVLTRSRGAWAAAVLVVLGALGRVAWRRMAKPPTAAEVGAPDSPMPPTPAGAGHRTTRMGRGTALRFAGVVVGAALLVFPFAARTHLADRVATANQLATGVTENSGRWRISLVQGALAMAVAQPVTGVGLGAFGMAYHGFQREAGFYAHDAHDAYLQAFDELGAAGGLLFLAMVGMAGWAVVRGLRASCRPGDRLVALGLAASGLHAAVDLDWQVPAILLAVAVLAGAVAGEPESALTEPGATAGDETAEVATERVATVPAALSGQELAARRRWRLAWGVGGALLVLGATNQALVDRIPVYGVIIQPWSPRGLANCAKDSETDLAPGRWAAALSRAPHDPGLRLSYAEALLDSDKPADAVPELRKVVAEAPYYAPAAYDGLALALARSGDRPAAVQALRAGQAAFPLSAIGRNEAYAPAARPELAELYLLLGVLGAATPADQAALGQLLSGGGAPYFDPKLATPWKAAQGYWAAVGRGDAADAANFGPPGLPPVEKRGLPWGAGPLKALAVTSLQARGPVVTQGVRVELGGRVIDARQTWVMDVSGWHLSPGSRI